MADYLTKNDLDKSLDMLVIKMIKHLDKQTNEIKKNIKSIDDKYDKLLTTLDRFLKRLDDIETNDAARDLQLARHDRWLQQIASKTDVKLSY
jgi:septal ring factor EnvC (AmiA/AmiB activator)